MKIWVDAQLPPTLATCLSDTFGLEAALRDKRTFHDRNFYVTNSRNAIALQVYPITHFWRSLFETQASVKSILTAVLK